MYLIYLASNLENRKIPPTYVSRGFLPITCLCSREAMLLVTIPTPAVGSPIFSLQSNSFIVGQGRSAVNSQWQTLFVRCPKLIEASMISSEHSIEFGQSFQQDKRIRSPLPTSSTFSAMLLLVERQSAVCHQICTYLET